MPHKPVRQVCAPMRGVVWHCRHIVEFKGVGCMEPQSPETMASTLFIVQEFMAGNTLKVHQLCLICIHHF